MKKPPEYLCTRAQNGTLPATALKWIKENLPADHWIRIGVEQQQMPLGAAILILCTRPSLKKEELFQAIVEIPRRRIGKKKPYKNESAAIRDAERNPDWEGTLWLRYSTR